MKGCYCLIIDLDNSSEIKIGKLGKIQFQKGHYVYVGSAMNYLESRIKRHLKSEKKLHWHIDYLLKKAEVSDVIYNESTKKVECELSKYISENANGIENFGCSDCDCNSHLYYFKNRNEAIECVKEAYDSIAMECKFFKK
ncbi:DUF123 domain-containing protein [uncultured Methanobrevibacter sp.]|uniref:GIY-YIG nuclease family protein n=1 Tax=uncultured Methanobrevibacter sp. TaxID=253161 RepID=UPI0025F0405E|nr:GIY-YIG nuclease family protein [uncultured Methanobrevibacter sp.]